MHTCFVKPFCVYACVCRCVCACVSCFPLFLVYFSVACTEFSFLTLVFKVFCKEDLMMPMSYTCAPFSLTIFVSPPIINLIYALIPISFKLLHKMYSLFSAIAFLSSSGPLVVYNVTIVSRVTSASRVTSVTNTTSTVQ